MGLLDQILAQAGGLDLTGIAQRVGLPPEKVEAAVRALAQQSTRPGDTAADAAADTGLPTDRLRQILDHLGGEETLARVAGALGQGGGIGGMLSGLFGQR